MISTIKGVVSGGKGAFAGRKEYHLIIFNKKAGKRQRKYRCVSVVSQVRGSWLQQKKRNGISVIPLRL